MTSEDRISDQDGLSMDFKRAAAITTVIVVFLGSGVAVDAMTNPYLGTLANFAAVFVARPIFKVFGCIRDEPNQ